MKIFNIILIASIYCAAGNAMESQKQSSENLPSKSDPKPIPRVVGFVKDNQSELYHAYPGSCSPVYYMMAPVSSGDESEFGKQLTTQEVCP